MNLPTFAEYASSRTGCGVKYTNNFKRNGGRFAQNLESLYFSHIALLDHYANEYLNDYIKVYCNYFDIELATNEINLHARNARKQQQQIKRNKMKNKK